jgi:hypothetical protein
MNKTFFDGKGNIAGRKNIAQEVRAESNFTDDEVIQ